MEPFENLQIVPARQGRLLGRDTDRLPAWPVRESRPVGVSDFWDIIRQKKLAILSAALLSGVAACLLTLPQTPVYQAQTTLEIQGINENFLHHGDVSPTSDLYSTEEGYVQTQVEELESRSLLRQVASKTNFISRLDARERPLFGHVQAPSEERTLKEVLKRLKVRSAPPTRIIRISFDSPDPKLSAEFANTLAEEYINDSLEARWTDGQNTITWLSRQLEDLKARLREAEDRLQDYTRSEGLTFLADNKGSVAQSRLQELEDEYSKAQAERIAHQSEYEVAQSGKLESLPRVLDSEGLADTQKNIVDLRGQLAEMSRALTPQHYKVQRLKAQIEALEGELAKGRADILSRIADETQQARLRENMLLKAYQQQKQVVADEAQKAVQYDLLKHEADTDRTLYDAMLQHVREAGIASAVRTSNVRIIDGAEPPSRPYKPDIIMNSALGTLSGLLIGVLFVCAGGTHDRRVRRPGESRRLSNTPELGVIPLSRGREFDVGDSVRSLVPSLVFTGAAAGQPRVIVVTSAGPHEGKTTIVHNLGNTLSEVARRVLLIDADLHRPRLDALFGVSNFWGLNNVLHDTYPIDDYPVEALGVPCANGLFVLPSGPRSENSADLLYSDRLTQLLARLRREFDIVLIDTPPLLEIPDARVLARQSDGVILVIRSGETSIEAVAECTHRLHEDGAVLLGTVLNAVSARSSAYTHYRKRKTAAG